MDEFDRSAFDDLFALDRRVREVAREVEVATRAVREGGDEHPFHRVSRRELAMLAPAIHLRGRVVSKVDEPLRAGILRWMNAFLLARVSHGRRMHLAQCRRSAGDGAMSFEDAWKAYILAPSDAQRMAVRAVVHHGGHGVRVAIDSLDELVAEAGRRASEGATTGARQARALGQGEARNVAGEGAGAARVLAFSEASTGEAYGRFRYARDGVSKRDGNLAFFDGLLARDAREGWPSRHLHVWLSETYSEFVRSYAPRALAVPTLVGAMSFLRLAGTFGAAVADVMVPSATPFAMAHEPLGLRRRVAFVTFALGVATAPFQRRALGLSGYELDDQLRALRRSCMQYARIHAARSERLRLGLPSASREARDLAEAFFAGVLSAEVAAQLAAPGDGFEFEVLLQGAQLAADAREALDDDWFRNPRAPDWFAERLGSHIGPYPNLIDAPGAAGALARLLGEPAG